MHVLYSFFVVIFFSQVSATSLDFRQNLKVKFDNSQTLNAAGDRVRNVATFYQQRDFKPIWLEGNSFNEASQNVLSVLKNAAQEGLDPLDYRRAKELMYAAEEDPTKVLDAEVAITSVALEYIDDLMGERLNPKKIDKSLYVKDKKIDAVKVMQDGMAKDHSGKWLAALTIKHPEYQLLKKELAYYLQRHNQHSYPILSLGAKIDLGSKGGRVETLQWQLSSLGFLSGAHKKGVVGTVTSEAIKAFQQSNDLKIDGIVGAKTITVLNSYNTKNRLRQLIVSMERWRWLPENLGDRYVFVNIAAFELIAIDKGIEKLRMPVIIGKKDRETPVLYSEISAIRFNPPWNVPQSIAVKDKLPKIRKDPEYLNRGGYILYDSSGAPLNPDDIDWQAVSESTFNFRIRQNPGDDNALGKIRFTIKTPFSIYLHSTPDKHLFQESIRSFSSGCVRVGDPKALAEFVFNDKESWPLERIARNMEGTETQDVALKKPVKVYITYFTVWHDKMGKIHYSPDLYGQDLVIWHALQNRKR